MPCNPCPAAAGFRWRRRHGRPAAAPTRSTTPAGPRCASPTPDRGFPPNSCGASSIRSTPPSGTAPAWGWRSVTASSSSTRGRSRWTARWERGPPCRCVCPGSREAMANVLIVDDERPIRRILAVLLQERHHRVTEAGSGEEALAALPEARPDLVLLDLKLAGIDGLKTLKRLRPLDPRLHVVLMTAHGTISSAVEAMRRGPFDYVTKPFDNDELLMVVDRALEVRRLN